MRFPARSDTIYYVVVDGVGGASGSVTLNYRCAVLPAFLSLSASRTVGAGTNVSLTVTGSAIPAPAHQWRFRSDDIGGANSSGLTLNNFQQASEGAYQVVLTNFAGRSTSAVVNLYNSP